VQMLTRTSMFKIVNESYKFSRFASPLLAQSGHAMLHCMSPLLTQSGHSLAHVQSSLCANLSG